MAESQNQLEIRTNGFQKFKRIALNKIEHYTIENSKLLQNKQKSEEICTNLLLQSSYQNNQILSYILEVQDLNLYIQQISTEQQLQEQSFRHALSAYKQMLQQPRQQKFYVSVAVQVGQKLSYEEDNYDVINGNIQQQEKCIQFDKQTSTDKQIIDYSKENNIAYSFEALLEKYEELNKVNKLQQQLIAAQKQLTQEKCKSMRFQQQSNLYKSEFLQSKFSQGESNHLLLSYQK